MLHATLVARRFAEGWRGALLRGASGAGKSELALRALDAGWRLVADDRVVAWRSGGRAFGRAPSTLAGLLEVRHVAIAQRPPLPFAPIALVCDLSFEPLERLPDARTVDVAGVEAPRIVLRAGEVATLGRLEAALEALTPHP